MPMTGASLRNRIQSKVEAATGNDMPAVALDVWEAIAEAIIEEIQTNAVPTCPAGTGTIA